MCKVLKVSRSGYYKWKHYRPSSRDHKNRLLLFEIRRIHQKSKATYGSPRITSELQANGFNTSRPRVARLMKMAGLKPVKRRKYVATTDSKHRYPIAENRLKRNFTAQRSAQVWVSDITYVKTKTGWLYLTVIIDLYDRKVVGWSISSSLKTEQTVIPAWKMAVGNRSITRQLIFHSDRGVQYACGEFTSLIKQFKSVQISMSRKADCWDNAVAESFFKTIKTELIYRYSFKDFNQAGIAIFEWIETWYNRHRRHSAIGYLSISEFEKINQYYYAA